MLPKRNPENPVKRNPVNPENPVKRDPVNPVNPVKRNPENPVNPVKRKKMELEHLTHKIIGSAYKVFNTLGFGFLESVYHKAMLIELGKAGLKAESEKPLTVHYAGRIVGEFSADIFVEDEVIVELKSVKRLMKVHEVQVVNYLTALKSEIGLLLNFGPTGVEVKRKYRKGVRQAQQD